MDGSTLLRLLPDIPRLNGTSGSIVQNKNIHWHPSSGGAAENVFVWAEDIFNVELKQDRAEKVTPSLAKNSFKMILLVFAFLFADGAADRKHRKVGELWHATKLKVKN